MREDEVSKVTLVGKGMLRSSPSTHPEAVVRPCGCGFSLVAAGRSRGLEHSDQNCLINEITKQR